MTDMAIPPAPPPPLTPERVFSSPSLAGPAPRGVAVSPDGRWVTWLRAAPDDQFKLDLWIAPIGAGDPRRHGRRLVAGASVEPDAQALTDAEKSRRERQRIASVSGVVGYDWDRSSRRL